ncbi:hypothetical protein BDN67DRAFT_336243 [Paxillus ammoniavirescens]|nr:hypothetical protein BDN67DRAFT_336243 [Paxillus ammoniavirescens]
MPATTRCIRIVALCSALTYRFPFMYPYASTSHSSSIAHPTRARSSTCSAGFFSSVTCVLLTLFVFFPFPLDMTDPSQHNTKMIMGMTWNSGQGDRLDYGGLREV